MQEKEILAALSPKISHQIIHMMRECSLGLCGGKIKITDMNSGSPTVSSQNEPSCDRFKVIIPYAGQTITWEVFFDSHYPEDPPDFIFGAEDQDFFPDLDAVASLRDWDYTDEKCLLHVFEELLYQYRKYEEGVINQSSRLSFEYSVLTSDTDIQSEDVEIHATRTDSRMGPINFLMKLHVDFERIPAYLIQLDPGDDLALLLVTFNSADGTRITPQLYLSPRVERALGGSSNLRIPGFINGTCLAEYVPSVIGLLKNKVDQIVLCYEKRKEFISAFISLFQRSVLEYDGEAFTKISFLFEWNDFFFIVFIELPQYFPKEQPAITLQSIYHEQKGKPYIELHQDYPYSPRWSGIEMAERTRSYILGEIGNFQKTSVISCTT